ncbi:MULTISPECIES: threonine--tRNA ligase [Clostridium]|uniref:Threonine--tRNA ligase n=2 Tax=Clostridium TaxID=1485 RepID=A0A151ARB7_9CLOT|nr:MULTISPECIES: threonine--tRNA ligase [Clostridium]KYH30191.1 threonine--tRNA ligase 2 [Clostridium colicanis DSM 13634]MBE6044579.1 threonine--tRNA ligase [Clostridium thermopalmarium]PRR76688.1 Threonine--tRNA ligase 2 [Clostridium thermopalmarium DSM 5974]PVZ23023.1 threonyl-tRNA synthetase [Clostridium thermopalmarium DSM 5974]
MVKITLKDGKILEVEEGLTVGEIASKISPSLRKKALGAKINGNKAELMDKVNEDCTLEILTFEDEDGRATLRHTASHILAQAVKRLYPDVKLAIGPAIDNGFYYDFDADFSFTPEILEKIEKEMEKIIKENLQLKKFILPREEAIKFMKERNEDYKVELIEDLPEDALISFYEQGEFVDLCAGPHVPSTKDVKAVKLLSVAGAYWRGNEKNKMLQRIYGTAFTKKSELDEYIRMMEEAKKRDHRKLGKELGLFIIPDEGPGFPLFLPKGIELKNALLAYWRELHREAGYAEIETPIILSRHLWENSGHWDHYKDNMYTVKIDDQDFAIKPMNCPGGMLAYKTAIHSYRELPLRYAELGRVHRHELSGALHGLMRVRAFTQDDAHIFMLPEQIKDEIKGVAKLIDEVYKTFGFKYHVELSTRPEDSMGTDEEWERAENGLREALEDLGLDYIINEGDGAFYGPKIDFHLEDCIGRTWQCGTIQLDMQMPQRFDLTYVGKDGEKHRPVMIHRVAFGSIERFIGILIEHYAGKFPVWLAPVQVKILPISDKYIEYATKVRNYLFDKGIRVEMDERAEKIGYKIREAQLEKVPYMLIIGEKEMNENNLSVRSRDEGDLGSMNLDVFVEDIMNKIEKRINTL